MRAIILGIGSDIGAQIAKRLRADCWHVTGYHHCDKLPLHMKQWDLLVCCYGELAPIGSFWEISNSEWEKGLLANALTPLRQTKWLYPFRAPGASVCFFSGAGAGGPASTYSAYAASKIMLTKMVELMDDESEDCKFFILGPGVVRTKIHNQTLRAGGQAANLQRVVDFVESGKPGTSHDDIYKCLMKCVAAPKAAVGGRNICVHLDDWTRLGELVGDSNAFKLRRADDARLRENNE